MAKRGEIITKVGNKYGLLTVKEMLPRYKMQSGKYRTYCKCDCECGNECIIPSCNLTYDINGNPKHTKSCGCLKETSHKYGSYKNCEDIKDNHSYTIYKHTAPNNKCYIGLTRNTKNRFGVNGSGYQTQVFGRAIKKYGWKNFKHEILEEGLNYIEANKAEMYYINLFQSNNPMFGYNITSGGDGSNDNGTPLIIKYSEMIIGCYRTHSIAAKEFNISSTTMRNYSNGLKDLGEFSLERISVEEYFDYKNLYDEEKIKMLYEILHPTPMQIAQYDLNGNYIKTWDSKKDILNNFITNDTSLTKVLKGEQQIAGNYMWKYFNGSKEKIPPFDDHSNRKAVNQYDLNGVYIATFKSAYLAEQSLNICKDKVRQACKGERKTAGGYIWRYADEVENNNKVESIPKSY